MALTKTKKSVIDVASIIGGADGQVQFNNSSDFGSSSDLTWDNVNKILSAKGLKIDNVRISPMTSSKNYLINGGMDIWQRSTASTEAVTYEGNEYIADRWMLHTTGDTGTIDNRSYSRQDFPSLSDSSGTYPSYLYPDVTDVDGNILDDPRYYVDFGGYANTVGAGGEKVYLSQSIEDVKILAGKTVVLTFWARGTATGGDMDIGVGLRQRFTETETTTVSSPGVLEFMDTITLTTSWKRYELTVSLDSIKGKALVENQHHTSLEFYTHMGANIATYWGTSELSYTGTVSLTQVQLEEGTTSTDFEKRMTHKEITMCQRYFEKTYNIDVDPGTITREGMIGTHEAVDYTWHNPVRFSTRKRANPTVVLYSPILSTPGQIEVGALGYSHAAEAENVGEIGIGSVLRTAGGGHGDTSYFLHYTSTAEFWE